MPYSKDKPPEIIKKLPKKAQSIWIAVFNAAHADGKAEETCMKIAWAAVSKEYEKDGEEWRAKADVSLNDIQKLICDALHKKFGPPSDNTIDFNSSQSPKKCAIWLKSVYPSYVIYEDDNERKCYRLSYSILEGVVTFGETPTEVTQEWIDVTKSQQALIGEEFDDKFVTFAQMGEPSELDGSAWEVTICKPGHTLNKWFIPDEVLQADAGLFENVDVNLFDLPQGATHLPDKLFNLKNLLTKKKVGWIDGVNHVAGMGLKGVLHFLDSAKWIGKNLLTSKQAGNKGYGLSFDYAVRSKQDTVDGKPVRKLLKFLKNDENSVDIVNRPAAGGEFNRAVAALSATEGEALMKEQLWALIFKTRPDLLTGKTLAGTSDEEVTSLARMALEPTPQSNTITQPVVSKPVISTQVTVDSKKLEEQIQLMQCKMDLGDRIATCGLPPLFVERIKKNYDGKVFTLAELDARIGEDKDLVAKMDAANKATAPQPVGGHIPSPDRHSIYVGLNDEVRAQFALDRMFGLTQEDIVTLRKRETLEHQPYFADLAKMSVADCDGFSGVPSFKGIREAYSFFTGDYEGTGRFQPDLIPVGIRAQMNITSTTFTYLLGNTLGRRLVRQYALVNYLEDLLVSIEKSVRDFRQQEAVLIGGFPDLATVDPEVADYQEIAGITDEESTYFLGQKGNILTISRKYIINDDMGTIQRKIDALGRAARRTHAKYVWALLTGNATCSDGTAWFTVGHGNLTTNTLSIANALTAYQWLAKTTEKDSGEKLCLINPSDPTTKPILLYPIDLMQTGQTITEDKEYYTSNDLTTKAINPLFGKLTGVQVPLMSDTTDWAMILPKNIADIVEMGYLGGRKEPLLFVADSEQSERMFLADDRRYKILHEYAGAVIDYRTGYKSENP